MTPEDLATKIAAHPDIAAKPTYLAYCGDCGGMMGCSTNEPEHRKDTARFVKECIEGGFTVTRGTTADVWGARWCDCHRKTETENQASLF